MGKTSRKVRGTYACVKNFKEGAGDVRPSEKFKEGAGEVRPCEILKVRGRYAHVKTSKNVWGR